MSANKKVIVQINRREYERLRQLERSSMFPPISQTQGFSNAMESALSAQMDELERKQQDYQRVINSMGNEMQVLESEAMDALVRQQQIFISQLDSVENNMAVNTHQLLAAQASSYQEVLHQNEMAFQDQLNELQEHISQYENDQYHKQELAGELIQDMEEVWNWHQQEYNWQQFLPDRMQEIEDDMNVLFHNYDMGNYESSIVLAQQTMNKIQRARINLVNKESEFELLCETVRQEATRLYELAIQHRTVSPIDIHGNILGKVQEINVNYWSEGDLQNFIDTVRMVLVQVREERETLTSQGLHAWLDNRLPELEDQLLNIIMQARENVLDSQLRTNITNIIIATMQQQGFSALDVEDHSNEIRQPNRLVMKNLQGDKVYIELAPQYDQTGMNHITIDSVESQPLSQHELHQRQQEVVESLGKYGVKIEIENEQHSSSNDHLRPVQPGNHRKNLRSQSLNSGRGRNNHYVPPVKRTI